MKYWKAVLLIILTAGNPALGKDYQLQALEDAHAAFRSAADQAAYADAAMRYELLVSEEGIHNGDLFYTTGNSWYMAGNIGRAILNYRRAELLMPNNADLKHNLAAALQQRTDLIPEQPPHPIAARLLGWHMNTTVWFRWVLFAAVWITFWVLLLWTFRSSRKEIKVGTAVTGFLAAALLLSLIADYAITVHEAPGVITANEVMARKGDGNLYAPAFMDPLHSGTEFHCLEEREGWMHIQLADGQTCWIPAAAAETVSL